ncbi:MAG: hydrogenase 3 maturation endopeptidase HyCI [Candidatus Omnitrophota bacterium]|nr:hydrogenase 3 maturation endopeptidase HyCI [Candidatus Omnitrophota bacterium]
MQSLKDELTARLKGAKRVAVLGVGSELRGDDVAGIVVLESIKKSKKKLRRGVKLKTFEGSTAPENLTGEIRTFKPTHLVIVDTADIGEKPGAVLLLRADEVSRGVSFSTHKIPPKILIDYFVHSLKCEIVIIGIQPKTINFGKPVSRTVIACAKSVASSILQALS